MVVFPLFLDKVDKNCRVWVACRMSPLRPPLSRGSLVRSIEYTKTSSFVVSVLLRAGQPISDLE